jgi:hypothetical protein
MAKNGNGSNGESFEKTLFKAADKLRKNKGRKVLKGR